MVQGTILRPQDVAVGDRLNARACDGHWWPAKVIKKRGNGARAIITVKYTGFSARHNEEKRAADGALRVSLCRAALRVERDMEIYNGRVEKRNDDGTWPIEKLLKCRVRNGKKQYRVRWEV